MIEKLAKWLLFDKLGRSLRPKSGSSDRKPFFHQHAFYTASLLAFTLAVIFFTNCGINVSIKNAPPPTVDFDTQIDPVAQGFRHEIWIDLTWDQLLEKNNEIIGWEPNYVLTDIETYEIRGTQIYAGVWLYLKVQGPFWKTENLKEFQVKWDEFQRSDAQAVDVEIYYDKGKLNFISTWLDRFAKQQLRSTTGWDSLKLVDKEMNNSSFRLVDLESFYRDGDLHFVGLWNKSNSPHQLVRTNHWKDFAREWKNLGRAGYRLHDFEIYSDNYRKYYLGIFHRGEDPHHFLIEERWSKFAAKDVEYRAQNFMLIDFEVSFVKGEPRYSAVWRFGRGATSGSPASP